MVRVHVPPFSSSSKPNPNKIGPVNSRQLSFYRGGLFSTARFGVEKEASSHLRNGTQRWDMRKRSTGRPPAFGSQRGGWDFGQAQRHRLPP